MLDAEKEMKIKGVT